MAKNKAVITITEEDEEFDVRVAFDPEYNKKNPTEAALLALHCVDYMGKLLDSDIVVKGKESSITIPVGTITLKGEKAIPPRAKARGILAK
jgi:hypothetical protein